MSWKGLKDLGPGFLTAVGGFLGILGSFIYGYGVEVAEEADLSGAFIWTLKGVAGALIFAGLVAAAAVVDHSLPQGVRQSKKFSILVALVTVFMLGIAGWYVGSIASSIAGGGGSNGSGAYARKMSSVLGEVAWKRGKVNRRLRQADAGPVQASVATDFAQMVSRRAAVIRAIHSNGDEHRATLAVAAGLDGLADAYSALAVAAKDRDKGQKGMNRARQTVNRAGEQLWRAEAKLEDHGYEVVVAKPPDDRLHGST